MKINILDARNRLSQLIKSASAGEDVVIANRGVPVARLVGIEAGGGSPGEGRQILHWLKANPLPNHARRDRTRIDAAIETERAGWD